MVQKKLTHISWFEHGMNHCDKLTKLKLEDMKCKHGGHVGFGYLRLFSNLRLNWKPRARLWKLTSSWNSNHPSACMWRSFRTTYTTWHMTVCLVVRMHNTTRQAYSPAHCNGNDLRSRLRLDDFFIIWLFHSVHEFCFLLIEFHCVFFISYEIFPYYVYYYCI